MHVGDRARLAGEIEVLTDRAAEELGLERIGRLMVERHEIGDRVPAHDAGHRRRAGNERGQTGKEAAG